MPKTCDLKDPRSGDVCGAEAVWIADVGWVEDGQASTPAYVGTSWSVALCQRHYEELLHAGRITGTAHKA
jgi:hypothetical protein